MTGFTNAFSAAVLDAQILTTDYVAWSENGTTESANLARTAINSWKSASVADPSVKGNNGVFLSGAASGAATITSFAIFSAVSSGTQKTDWTALGASKTLASGDKLDIEDNTIQVTLT